MGKNKVNTNKPDASVNKTQELEETKRISKGFVKNNTTKSK
jgi:hypothetical protein